MKKSWKLTEKIVSGEKTIESRWYRNKSRPWNNINKNDIVYFKNSGEKVKIMAEVSDVLQFSDLTQDKVKEILNKYGAQDGISKEQIPYFFNLFKNKRYCMLIFLKNPKTIEPFDINKKGFGMMSAWINVDDVEKIKVKL